MHLKIKKERLKAQTMPQRKVVNKEENRNTKAWVNYNVNIRWKNKKDKNANKKSPKSKRNVSQKRNDPFHPNYPIHFDICYDCWLNDHMACQFCIIIFCRASKACSLTLLSSLKRAFSIIISFICKDSITLNHLFSTLCLAGKICKTRPNHNRQ